MFDIFNCVGSASAITSAISIQAQQNAYQSQQQSYQNQLGNYQAQQAYNQGMQNAYNQLGYYNQVPPLQTWAQTFNKIPTMQDDINVIVLSILQRGKRWRQAEPLIACNEQRADEYEENFKLSEDEFWLKCRMEARLRKEVE